MALQRLLKKYKYGNTRSYLRLPADWPIKYKTQRAPGSDSLAAMRNVSAAGVAVTVREPVAAGSRIRLEIHVTPLGRSIAANGQVVRCTAAPGGGFQMGVRFLEIDPKDRADLNSAVEKFYGAGGRTDTRKTWWRKIS